MATNFPTSLDALTNPTATNSVATVSHSSQHINANDAIEALEAKVGADSSAVTTSHDYKLSEVTTTDKAVGKTASQTLTNKTLTSPVISTISNTGVITLPTSTDTLVGKATTDVLTNKTLTSPVINTSISGTAIVDEDNMASNSDTKVPTQQSVKAYVDSVAIAATVVNYLSQPVGFAATSSTQAFSVNTTQYLGLISITAQITVNSITIEATAVGTAGTLDLTVYSENGQTQKIAVTTASIAGTGNVTTAVSSVVLAPGNYWFAVNPNGTADVTLRTCALTNHILNTTVASEAPMAGTQAISAGVPAATFTPTSLTGGLIVPLFRLDN